MRIYKLLTLFLLSNLFLLSCDLIPKKNNGTPQQTEDGVRISKTYYKSGSIKSEITVKNNKKNGPAKKYYTSGELHTLVNYVNNIKEGETIWYYKNGQPYRVTNYVHGKIQGIRKIYYENGKLQAEIPYKNGELIEGTKEYNESGELIKQDISIIFKTKDLIKFENKYYLQMSLSNKSKRVKFYEIRTYSNGESILNTINTKNGIGQMEFLVVPGSFVMKTIKVRAEYKSKLGNTYLISGSYNLAIEN